MDDFAFFISHSSKTKELAKYIYNNAILNGIFPWYDESNLELGKVLEETIRRGIENSKAFLLLHSRPALDSEWVKMEMRIAKLKKDKDSTFKIFVVKLDELEPSAPWSDFVYLEWNPDDSPGSILKLIESLTGKKGISRLTASSLLVDTPFVNESGKIAEHTKNYVLYYLSHLKNLISSVSTVGHDDELRDTLAKILKLNVFEQIPSLTGGIMPIEPGVWEIIHANRMRIAPRVAVQGLPDKYKYRILDNNEIFTKVQIIDRQTNKPVSHIVPITLTFDSRL